MNNTVIKGRTKSAADCSGGYIDNTNFQATYNRDEVPLVSVTTNNGDTWRSALLGYNGTVNVLEMVELSDGQIISLQPNEIVTVRYDECDIRYLNRITDRLNGSDGKLTCDTDEADKARLSMFPILKKAVDVEKKNRSNRLIQLLPPTTKHIPRRIPTLKKPVNTSAAEGKRVVYVKKLLDVFRGQEISDGFFAAQYLDRDCPDGKIAVAWISYADSRKLIKERTMIPRREWDSTIGEMSILDDIIPVYDVNDKGLVFVEAESSDKVGTSDFDTQPTLAYQRDGVTFAEWTIDDNVDLDINTLEDMLDHTYGNFGVDRPCTKSNGRCIFDGFCNAAYSRPTSRKDKDNVTKSQLHREQHNTTLKPVIRKNVNVLTDLALRKRKESDPVYERLHNLVAAAVSN